MRTTLTLDDDVAARLKAEARRTGKPFKQLVNECLRRRLLINCTHGTVLRLLPALNLTDDQLEEGCDILSDVLLTH